MMKYNLLHKLLIKDGWEKKRQNGSHVIYTHPGKNGNLVVPHHGTKEVPNGLLKSILKAAKLDI